MKLNQPKSPCVEDPNYNFAHCVEGIIASRAGCKPYWNKVPVNDGVEVPICKNVSMLYQYGIIYTKLQEMTINDLVKASGCLMPCSFMEYTVSFLMKLLRILKLRSNRIRKYCTFVFQSIQSPLKVPNQGNGTSAILNPVFDGKVEVITEQEAYPFRSLVSDVGGILGLFIGFNFLIVWGIIVKCVIHFIDLRFKCLSNK